jgi:hypothetical protein
MTHPAWHPDPYGAPATLRWWDGWQWTTYTAPLLSYPGQGRPPLDVTVDELKRDDPVPWGVRPVLVPLLTYVVLIVAGGVTENTIAPQHGNGARVFDVVANVLLEGILGVAVYFAGRDVARRNGGWGRAFGLRWPRRKDLLWALAGLGIAFGARIVIAIVAQLLSNGNALKESENIHVKSVSVFTAVLLVVVVVLAAPFVEEIVFRGLLLRTFMRRMTFWPAALLSTAIFGLGHTYEVDSFVGAVTLAAIVGSLGLANCILNRYTDRLAAGMLVHGTFNGLAVLVLLLQTNN